MKKQNLKSLTLTKKTITSFTTQVKGGIHTVGCYTRQICPIDPVSDPLDPIPEEPTLFEASVCFCYSAIC